MLSTSYFKELFPPIALIKVPKKGTFRRMTDSNKAPNEYRLAITKLKYALKQKHLTYRDLADGIGLSESGVKKIFIAQDGSFQRLAQICRFVDISLSELIEDKRSVNVAFSEAQQKAFLSDESLFHFYWILVYERQTLSYAERELAFDKSQSFRALHKLDRLGLIKLMPGDRRIRLPSIKAVSWAGRGKFVQHLYQKWGKALFEKLAGSEKTKDDFFLLRYLQMTPKTYAEFLTAQQRLEEEFISRAIQEMRLRSSKLQHVRWLVAVDNLSFVNGKKLTPDEQ